VDVLDELRRRPAAASRSSLLRQPTVASLVIGARNEDQLRDNLGAAGWALDADQVARLGEVSRLPVPYPYNHQQEKPYFLPAPWTTA
jgi:aryl-alcohol dehydrogenase-like predicted oxidoreductase